MKLRKPTLLAATLLASLTFSACQAENHDNSTTQTTTAQQNPQKTANHSKDEEATKESNVAEVTTSENSTETQENQPSSPIATKTIDFQALSQGDYSSISGNWSNANGDSFVIDAQGHITTVFEGTSQEGYSIQPNHIAENMFLGGLIAPNGQAQTNFMIIPAGVPTPNTRKTYDQDVICSGQSSLSEDNPYFEVK